MAPGCLVAPLGELISLYHRIELTESHIRFDCGFLRGIPVCSNPNETILSGFDDIPCADPYTSVSHPSKTLHCDLL